METFEVLKQVQDKHEHRMADYLNASTNEMVLDAMQEYTKPLIDEIAELRKEVEYQKSGYITLKEYLKTDDILCAIMKLKSELKASKSEANEALQKSHDELLKIAKHYIKNHDYWVIANADKLTRNNK